MDEKAFAETRLSQVSVKSDQKAVNVLNVIQFVDRLWPLTTVGLFDDPVYIYKWV